MKEEVDNYVNRDNLLECTRDGLAANLDVVITTKTSQEVHLYGKGG